MIKSGTNVRKFQFFEKVNKPVSENEKENIKDNNELNKEKLNITLDNISINGPKQMHTIDGYIFINGKAAYKKEGVMVRENLIMKILDNEVIDEFRIFNVVYYDFCIKKYEEKPYFIIVGSSFYENFDNGEKEVFMMTSIKIYNATTFIKSKNKIEIEIEKGIQTGAEPYPKFLNKQIKLLKRLSDGKLVCEKEEKMEKYESFQNINAFSINDNFTHAAISIEGVGNILVYGYPNLIECNTNEINMIYLPKIRYGEREVNITNLEFAILNIQNEMKRVLYATTGNSIYYYIWKYETENTSNSENNIMLRELSQERIGAYSGCISVKGSSLLIGSSNDDFIGEYNNLEFGKTWFFDGKKTFIDYYNDYILFAIFGESESYLEIYDRKNQFFVYYQADKKRIISVCHDNNYIYILYEESLNKKFIRQLKEKNNKDKFETFFQKKFFDDAVLYAENLGFDKKKISEISRKHAEYEYSKGNYEKSIDEYIKTIQYYEPTLVIQKFLEKTKLKYLVKYIESIIYNMDFKVRDIEENKNYTTLLLHCYIMQEEIDKLKDFIDKKGQFFSKEIIKTVIDVCIETENIEMGLSIAKQYKMIEDYLRILIIHLNNYDEAINILEETEKNEFDITNQDKIKLYHIFSEYFLKNEEGKEDYSDKFFESVLKFIENNKKTIDKKDVVKLIEIFMDSDKFFKVLFGIMESYDLDYNKEMIHRRIQLYLDDLEKDKKNKAYENEIIDIIKNEKYISKYDSQYLIMLFKKNNFLEGIEILSEIHKYNQDLLYIYMEKKEYDKIINLCKNYGVSEHSFWGTSLNYFISKDNRKNLTKEETEKINNYLEIFLKGLFQSKIMNPINILDIIYEKNNDIPFYIINNLMIKSLENDINSIENEEKNYNEFDTKIEETVNEIKELKTKAYTFNLIKCCECRLPIELPTIVFKCGHGFHTSCINTNITDETECPKCKNKKYELLMEIKNNDNFYKNINTLGNLEKELEQKGNKTNFLYELYGKGLFNLGSVKENKI